MILIKTNYSFFTKFFLILFLFGCSSVSKTVKSQNSDFLKSDYVLYFKGNLPIIISVPHGGNLVPDSIPNRNCNGCVYVTDSYTQQLANSIKDEFLKKTGSKPHIIINLLSRKKLDANRDKQEAANGNEIAEKAWSEYHNYINIAKNQISASYKRGLFIDLHGHAHKNERLELGYLLKKEELQAPDSLLNTAEFVNKSSIRVLIDDNKQQLMHSEILRDEESLGTILENNGISAVPSISNPFPLKDEKYFSGGYNTKRHGSLNGGNIDAIQMECHQNIRFDSIKRKEFASVFVTSINKYIELHYNKK